MSLLRIAIVIYLLMLPVTAMVPVLAELTYKRFPGTGDVARHLFMSVNMFGALLGAPLAGLLSDLRARRTSLIVIALLINGASLLLIGADIDYSTVLAVRFIEGCAHMAALSLLMALAADHARTTGLGAAMGGVGAAISLGVASGAPLGGLIGSASALAVPWYGGWLMLVLAGMVALLLRDAPANAPRLHARALLRALTDNRMLAVPYAFAFVDRLTVGFIVSTFTLYLASAHGFAPSRIGLVMAVFMIPFALLTWPAGMLSRHWDRFGMMILGSVLYGVFLAALGFAPVDWIIALMAAGGVVAALMYAPSLVLATELAGPGQRASTLAGFNVAGSLGFALGPLLGGVLVGHLRELGLDPYQPVFMLVAATEVGLALAMLPMWRRLRRKRAHAAIGVSIS